MIEAMERLYELSNLPCSNVFVGCIGDCYTMPLDANKQGKGVLGELAGKFAIVLPGKMPKSIYGVFVQ